jgi:hypothetical protein
MNTMFLSPSSSIFFSCSLANDNLSVWSADVNMNMVFVDVVLMVILFLVTYSLRWRLKLSLQTGSSSLPSATMMSSSSWRFNCSFLFLCSTDNAYSMTASSYLGGLPGEEAGSRLPWSLSRRTMVSRAEGGRRAVCSALCSLNLLASSVMR